MYSRSGGGGKIKKFPRTIEEWLERTPRARWPNATGLMQNINWRIQNDNYTFLCIFKTIYKIFIDKLVQCVIRSKEFQCLTRSTRCNG